ncbi:unnamed protein product [Boreogadus saida]
MLLEVKVALNFIVSYLYNKLPRRRADLFGEELERLLVARFEGHWYPEAPLRGSAFRCLHLGAPRDPVVELAARRSGLDTEEVRANVPAELSIWVDPYEVSYQIGEQGALKVLYLEDPPGPGGGAEPPPPGDGAPGDGGPDEARSLGFNPDAQPITFTTASFAATKFGSTKMKKSSAAGPGAPGGPGGVAVVAVPPQRILSRSPPPALPPTELLKHKPLALALHALGAPGPPSQLSPNAKEFVFPGSPGALYFEVDPQPMASPFQPPPHLNAHPSYDPFARPAAPGPGGGLSYGEKPPFGEGLGGYSLQYPPQSFPPVVLAN